MFPRRRVWEVWWDSHEWIEFGMKWCRVELEWKGSWQEELIRVLR